MQFDDYQAAAVATANADVDTIYLATKLIIEASEATQVIIKRYYHGAPLDLLTLSEELGDTLWYIAALAHAYNIGLDDLAQANLAKLRRRHGTAYNPAHYTVTVDSDSDQEQP